MSNISLEYKKISEELQERIRSEQVNNLSMYACCDEDVIRRNGERDTATIWRPAFVRDCEKIIHLPTYNRYTDKTQVFSTIQNDDVSRRALHVQLVSRIARNIGRILGLNCDLIEAISLGHDLGHTPFGHAGEKFLSDILQQETGEHFNHNIQSGRVLDAIFMRNVSLQTLDGIICHNGEFEMKEYRPNKDKTFTDYDREVAASTAEGGVAIKKLVPMTLEGCVVRISDMIAYIGKDRQDAVKSHLIDEEFPFTNASIGTHNATIINNITVDIIENSYGRDCIILSDDVYRDLAIAKKENYEHIYHSRRVSENYEIIGRMFEAVYEKLLDDLRNDRRESPVFRHHVNFVEENRRHYKNEGYPRYIDEPYPTIVTDYIASMTDSYFISLYEHIFGEKTVSLKFAPYFG